MPTARGSAPMVVKVWDLRPRDGLAQSWEGVVALNARGRKICGAFLFYVQQFFEITFRNSNIPMNL
jgi:hypothetical protein